MKNLNMPTPTKTAQKAPAKKTMNTERQDSGDYTDLNFKVSAEFKKEFKIFAAEYGLKQKEVLERAFEELKKNYG